MPTGRSRSCSPRRMGCDWNYTHPSRDHGRDRRADADLRRRHLREARRDGLGAVAVQRRRRPKARRSCTSTASCAARASSCITEYVPTDEKTGPRFPLLLTTGPHPVASTTSARRRGARRTSSGTTRTCWRSTRTTPRSAASATATGCGSPAAPARRRCGRTITDRVAPGVVYTTFHHPDDAGQRRHHRLSPTGRPTARNTR